MRALQNSRLVLRLIVFQNLLREILMVRIILNIIIVVVIGV